MKRTSASSLLVGGLSSVLSALFAAGCAVESEPVATAESAQTSASNCSFIPGCKSLLEAYDGPLYASVMTYDDASGRTRRYLSVSYREPYGSHFLLCDFLRRPSASIVFVLGPEGARTSLSQPMGVHCTSYGDNSGQTDLASFTVVQDEDPALWDTLFPPAADGSRWYAMRVAVSNAQGSWDSRFGNDYRLVLAPH